MDDETLRQAEAEYDQLMKRNEVPQTSGSKTLQQQPRSPTKSSGKGWKSYGTTPGKASTGAGNGGGRNDQESAKTSWKRKAEHQDAGDAGDKKWGPKCHKCGEYGHVKKDRKKWCVHVR